MTSVNHSGGLPSARPQVGGSIGELTVRVPITRYIAHDFAFRGAFLEILRQRIDIAHKQGHAELGTGYHNIDLALAYEIKADATRRYGDRSLSRAGRIAYKALLKRLAAAINLVEEQPRPAGHWIDPGIDEARMRASSSPAQLPLGEKVLYFYNSDTEFGKEATVVGSFQMYAVLMEEGSFVLADGRRFDYKFGYHIRLAATGVVSFACPHQLTREDCRLSHLRLVSLQSESAGGLQ